MNILDRLTYKINQMNNPQEKQMYQDIYTNLLIAIHKVWERAETSKSHLTDRIEFNIETYWDYKSIEFRTTLDNHKIQYLLRFNLYHTHYEFQYLYF
jgi:hypothetical protein